MLTIVAALNDEIRLIRSEMEIDKVIHIRPFSIFTGKFQNTKINLIRTGLGKEATEKAINYCARNLKSTLLMNIGYAGGLDPHLHPGDIVIASSVIDESTENSWSPDQNLIEKAVSVIEAAGLRYHTGKIVTVNKAITDPHEKAFTGTRFDAIACEMESSTVAEIAAKANIPVLVVRSVVDPMDTEVPEIPEKAIVNGKLSLGPLVKHLRSSPKDLLKLPKFSYLANQARISITNFLREWMKHEQDL